MEINRIGRPRNLGWIRAAAILYGDWGTSKAYVLGIALSIAGFAALPHTLAVCAVTGLVGLNYILVCKFYPTGGGVYTAAQEWSPRLAVIGALLLLADYIVTVSLSGLSAFKYFGVADNEIAKQYAITAIFAVGAMNFFGPKFAGTIATWMALPTVACVIVIMVAGVPFLGEFRLEPMQGGVWHNWTMFVGMILALSGVEAVANMTGVMRLDPGATEDKPKVTRTSAKAILVVMLEVVVGTAFLAVLVQCLPKGALQDEDDLLRYMAGVFVGPQFAWVVGLVFAVLLLSACNTAINGMVAVIYMMARNKELPAVFLLLNPFGVPWVALILATVVPVIVLNQVSSIIGLAEMYAIGVVGAITINLGCCSLNRGLDMKRVERGVMLGTFVLLAAIWITIAVTKIDALIFAGVVMALGIGAREFTQYKNRRDERLGRSKQIHIEHDAATDEVQEVSGPPEHWAKGGKTLLAVRTMHPSVEFAIREAKRRKVDLHVLLVREIMTSIGELNDGRDSPRAKAFFEQFTRVLGKFPFHRYYAETNNPADTIVDLMQRIDADVVILAGVPHNSFETFVKGNNVRQICRQMPKDKRLVIVR